MPKLLQSKIKLLDSTAAVPSSVRRVRGDHDDFGFETGATALDRILTSRRIPHEVHIYPGRHDWPYFAEHLPASLQFHSKLFRP
jgi:S-formylglutathione hydrolase FrmB